MSKILEFDVTLEDWLGRITAFDSTARTFNAQFFRLDKDERIFHCKHTFPIADLSDYDAKRITIGAIVRWEIGYIEKPRRKRTSGSRLTFYEATTGDDGDHLHQLQ